MNKLRHKLINICDTTKKEREGRKEEERIREDGGRKEDRERNRELALILLKETRKLHCFINYMI